MRKASITRNGSGDANADAALAKMGYASELPGNFEYAEYSRNVRMDLSYLGFLLGLLICSRSFAIMAVPFGLSTTLYITLTDGQSVTILWGWVLVSLISLTIAASPAEICAVYLLLEGSTTCQPYFRLKNMPQLHRGSLDGSPW